VTSSSKTSRKKPVALTSSSAKTKQKRKENEAYCLPYKAPCLMAFQKAEIISANASGANLRALCGVCASVMHGRFSLKAFSTLASVLRLAPTQAHRHLTETERGHFRPGPQDYNIDDKDLISSLQARFLRRVVPEIAKVHQFKVTRMERYIVSCYDAEDGGQFAAHRDNTTAGTAHRRFAVSVNLNDDFDGGEVSFPEYGPRSFKAPPGGAVVFSCSLLHAVSKVTRGRRYAFLPFLYDEAAAKLRQENLGFLDAPAGGMQNAAAP
jgi:hypothetical protein